MNIFKNIKLLLTTLFFALICNAGSLLLDIGGTSISNYTASDIYGFPVHFIEKSLGHITFQPLLFLINYGFWFLFVFSFINIFFIKNTYKTYKISSTFILSFLLMIVTTYGAGECSKGFPVIYKSLCEGAGLNISQWFLSAIIIDYIFWFVIATIFIYILFLMEDGKKPYKYILIPLLVTLIGFFHEISCGGFLCLFAGNGFPIAYFHTNFSVLFFIIDVLLNTIIYVVLRVIFLASIKSIHKTNPVSTK